MPLKKCACCFKDSTIHLKSPNFVKICNIPLWLRWVISYLKRHFFTGTSARRQCLDSRYILFAFPCGSLLIPLFAQSPWPSATLGLLTFCLAGAAHLCYFYSHNSCCAAFGLITAQSEGNELCMYVVQSTWLFSISFSFAIYSFNLRI